MAVNSGITASGIAPAQALQLCYAYGTEAFLYVGTVSTAVDALYTWSSATGGVQTAVVGVQELLSLQGFGTQAGDQVKFIASGTSCSANVLPNDEGGPAGVLTVGADGAIAVTFQTVSTPRLCYRFANELWLAYPSLSIAVAHVAAVNVQWGATDVAVSREAKSWTFTGGNLYAGDQVRSCQNMKIFGKVAS